MSDPTEGTVTPFPRQGDNYVAPEPGSLAERTHALAKAMCILIQAQLPDAPREVRESAAITLVRIHTV